MQKKIIGMDYAEENGLSVEPLETWSFQTPQIAAFKRFVAWTCQFSFDE